MSHMFVGKVFHASVYQKIILKNHLNSDYWMMLMNVKFRLKSSIIIGKTQLYLIRFQILVMVNFCLKVDDTIKSNSLIYKWHNS